MDDEAVTFQMQFQSDAILDIDEQLVLLLDSSRDQGLILACDTG